MRLCIAVLLSCWRGAAADEAVPEPAPQSITLTGALEAAGQAPARRSAAARTAAAARSIPAAGAWPSTALGAATTAHTPRAVVTASLPIPIFGTLGAAHEAARAGYDVARAEEGLAQVELRHRVAVAWIELARAEALAMRAAETAALETALADVARRRFEAGDTARADVVATNAAAARARAQASARRATVAAASASLAAELGWEPAALLHAEPGLPEPGTVPALAGLRERAAAHPQVQAARARVDLERARVAQVHAARWPQLFIDLEGDFDDPTLPGNDYKVGLGVQVPLFGRGSDIEAQAELQRRAALAEQAASASQVEGQLVAAYRRHQAAAARARTLAVDVVPAQREAAALAQTAYREGQGGLADVLVANRALAEAQIELVDALAEAATARADLEQAAGGAW